MATSMTSSQLSTWLSNQPVNTKTTPYEINITDMHDSAYSSQEAADTVGVALRSNPTKYVDLSSGYYCASYDSQMRQYNLYGDFSNCPNLIKGPKIRTLYYDESLSITNATGIFANCINLIDVQIESHISNPSQMFMGCTSLTTTPITSAEWIYSLYEGCTSLKNIGTIRFHRAEKAFKGCTNLETVGGLDYDENSWYGIDDCYSMFEGCPELKTISSFNIPLETFKNNAEFRDFFKGCTNLRTVGFTAKEDDWHLYSLKFGNSDVSGKIYSRDGTSVTIPSTSITKSTIKMPILTDELWFPDSGVSDNDVDTAISNLLSTQYSWYEGTTIEPNGSQFVLYADDPNKVTTNLSFPSNVSNATGVLPVAHGGTGQTSLDSVTVGVSKNTSALDKAIDCNTAAGTAAKTVTLAGFTLVKGAKLIVNLKNANTAQSALTLNVNSTGAKTIRWNGSTTSSSTYAMTATQYNCYYDGTYWNMDSVYEARSARTAAFADQSDYSRGNAYCPTAAGTQAKVASMRGYVLATGGRFPITFIYANSYNGKITLNVNSKGAKDVYIDGVVSSSSNKTLPAGTYMCSYFNGCYYIDTKGKPSDFDIIHPINEVYVQFPQQKSPNDLWGSFSTWTEITEYSGAFFRASGGNASAFIEAGTTLTKQNCQNKYHKHSGTTNGASADIGINTASGSGSWVYDAAAEGTGNSGYVSVSQSNSGSHKTYGSSTTGWGTTTMDVSHSHSISQNAHSHGFDTGYDGSSSVTEARPDNYTIKIWKRTA